MIVLLKYKMELERHDAKKVEYNDTGLQGMSKDEKMAVTSLTLKNAFNQQFDEEDIKNQIN